MTTTTDLPDLNRLAVAVVRAHANADDAALRALLDPLPIEQVPSLLAALTELVIVAQQSPRGSLGAFLNGRLADVNAAEVIASLITEQPTDEPDDEG